MRLTLFLRNFENAFSVENITRNLSENLPKDVDVTVHVSKYPNTGLFNRLKAVFEARRHQGDVNHITGDVNFLILLLNKRKTIITILDCEKLMGSDYGFLKKIIYRLIWFTIPALIGRYLTTISTESKKNLIQYAGIKDRKLRVIYYGVDNRFKTLTLTQDEKKRLLGNQEAKKTVMHISGAMAHKNVCRLIEALEGMDIKLIKVGALSSQELSKLKEYKIDYLQFKSVPTDLLLKIYNAVDCLVFPSLVEGLGLPVVEAQKCGCPVVTSNISSLPEVAGAGAVLIDPYSVKSIREGISDVLNDNIVREKIIREGFKNSKRFEWKTIANQYCLLYREVLSKYQMDPLSLNNST